MFCRLLGTKFLKGEVMKFQHNRLIFEFLFLINILLVVTVSGKSKQVKYRRIAGRSLAPASSEATESESGSDQSICMHKCNSEDSCSAFEFVQSSRTCIRSRCGRIKLKNNPEGTVFLKGVDQEEFILSFILAYKMWKLQSKIKYYPKEIT